jgi:hypothetical protein
MFFEAIAFGLVWLFIGYSIGATLTKARMKSEQLKERDNETRAFNAERTKWIERGREIERGIRDGKADP